jgi:putative membrane protein insertion efficiency factor
MRSPTRAPRPRPSAPAYLGMAGIRGYQRWLSHRLPTSCPHEPTCSHYGLAAIGRYGLWQGGRLTAGRIARCSRDVPRGTADPVPGAE